MPKGYTKKQNKKSHVTEKINEYLRESQKVIEQKEEEVNIEIPQQAEFFKTPVRFGNIPVDKLPIGCDEKEQYRKIYPKISLPFQVVERISFGHKDLEPNRLIFGDNLHIMRGLPSNSIDLIYIDPPFFSGRNYNVVFGDQNEVRSFSDIWEGGMPGYLTWLNARILEMKRILKPTGSIFVHCDYHAAHYIKVELDKIFGYDNFRNEIIWRRAYSHNDGKKLGVITDTIFSYSKTSDYKFKKVFTERGEEETKKEYPYIDEKSGKRYKSVSMNAAGQGSAKKFGDKGLLTPPSGTHWRWSQERIDKAIKDEIIFFTKNGVPRYKQYAENIEGKQVQNLWFDFMAISSQSDERIGYPTQKPEELLNRIISMVSEKGDIIADFFCGGGTTPTVAQKLGRRWIASDISKIAVSVTRDRILRDVLGKNGDKKIIQHTLGKTPDIEIKNWGVYEVPEIIKMNEETFRNFIIAAYNGRLASSEGKIHGYKQSVPIFVGSPSQEESLTEKEVIDFAKHIVKSKGHHQGIMIAWGFTPGARNAAQQLATQHAVAIDFVKIQLVPIESKEFKEHITSKHPEYKELLKFILPPQIRISTKRISHLEYDFDVSESVSLNPFGRIINVQWDFSYNGERFISTPGYSFLGMKNNKPVLKVNYKFDSDGKKKVACKVQDDEGGEKIEILEIEVK
ncbi:MAG: site-specific DNA-methyltransferase [Ignavibacteriae bacterium]|nr:site-specific DNA-methyltransferase [Ignavibacteriota bacterium]